MSLRASDSLPSSCSGAMYWNVPRIVPCCVIARGISVGRDVAEDEDFTAGSRRLREAEVEELHARLRQHDVAGLQVAVDDAGVVRRVEGRRDLDRDLQELLRRERPLEQPLHQRLAVGQLHDEEVPRGRRRRRPAVSSNE